jgi:hypothetical protein
VNATSIKFTAITKIADEGDGGIYEVVGKDFPRSCDRFLAGNRLRDYLARPVGF